ncbi:hybrid sensor histidine kinase/response regulator [Aporhodopirellula aestuarii]|uniref:histidine kinase n=1 Tax=Aporhodopirellula aestuarii TaxID=2950107 RepID=A0ABT0U9Q9_9BACT|nr:response regulator [Aporhodopirellula aestuarii]MCM2373606.1 response regulator [Aporhodopirellula aestuarii]
MEKSELMLRLMSTFLEELHERMGEMNRDLLALEKEPAGNGRQETLKSLFRSTHTIKGASCAVGVDVIERACHLIEDMLTPVRDDDKQLSPSQYTILFKTFDAIEEAGMRLRDDQNLDQSPLQSILPQLEAAIADEDFSEETLPDVEPVGQYATKPAAATSKGMSVRVSAEKLDDLLAQNGELLVAERRVAARTHDVSALSEAVANWKADWKTIEKPLRRIIASESQPRVDQIALPRHAAAIFERIAASVGNFEKQLDHLSSGMKGDGRLLRQVCSSLDGEVRHIRMLPFAEACSGLERAVRDVARNSGKEVQLIFEGESVEVDRSVLEGLKDPLLHIVRNAVDHGIELPKQRLDAGKPIPATVKVSAALRGGQVEIVVADDGRGFDLEKIRAKLKEKQLPQPDSDRELARAIFLPGFSTAATVTDISGRGVGLDVVQTQIESLHGTVDVHFEKGKGASFVMCVPLTLTTLRSVLVKSANQIYAIPTVHVQHLVRFGRERITSLGNRDALLLGDAPMPLTTLCGALGVTRSAAKIGDNQLLAIVLGSGEQSAAFVVDELISEQEVTVKNLGTRIRRVRHVAGATLLPSGHVALVLNVANLIRSSFGIKTTPILISADRPENVAVKEHRILVVDDSMTTRALIKSILETAGYDVSAARDGQHALDLLNEHEFDLVVSDVDMPRLDGFGLTTAIRAQERLKGLPVVLVTARGTEEDKVRGINVGADAYIVKSGFEQTNLLDTVSQLL